MDGKCILAVYAHPDDEAVNIGGTFRKYHAAGIKTALICATRGEAGSISDRSLASPETLGVVREKELRAACRILGIEELVMLGYRDGKVVEVDKAEATGQIVYHLRRLRPQVVVTFDANGDYGHPDHMAVHRLVVSAFHQAGDPRCFPEQLSDGVRPHTPAKLYAHAMARSVMRKVFAEAQAKGTAAAPSGSVATIPLHQMGTRDEDITVVVPLDECQFGVKLVAMQAHQTQMDTEGPFTPNPNGAVREWLSTERFRLLYPRNGQQHESDLFAGIV